MDGWSELGAVLGGGLPDGSAAAVKVIPLYSIRQEMS